MKELIYQRPGDFLFWKIDDDYSLLFIANKRRKKEKEYALTSADREQYFEKGINFIIALAESMS